MTDKLTFRKLSVETFVAAAAPKTMVKGQSYYTATDGLRLMSTHIRQSKADVADTTYVRYSEDNGRTWSQPEERLTAWKLPAGTLRMGTESIYPDPGSDRAIVFWRQGILPTDHPLEYLKQLMPYHAVAVAGGRRRIYSGPIICCGAEFDAEHPLPGVTLGKASGTFGERGSRPLTLADGTVVVPMHAAHLGADGERYNPGGGYTYTDCLVLLGRWQPDGRLQWRASERIVADPKKTTRGVVEPTIARLADDSLLMIMRGSNDANPDLPGYKWQSRSTDGGMTWSQPEPWTDTRGESFFSPSACSQLVPWSDGRLFWIGNICHQNPRGNDPRYPLVAARVDVASGLLVRESVTSIDDLQPEDDGYIGLSNFYAREDRESGELVLHLTRSCPGKRWEANALLYRIAVN